ncbi:uncharacterized protein SAPINGB_P004512 [Magnusiomyces paraingens]|uniref:3-isopropylmalate dehydrogenase n=1 Tax=Magnusiomyces paraingens TaxID=2606893 RepID=A0A5E8BZY5_9ASCO|nr:uncharacterized protein SAPINGB_P004512 [Saprochaete ingens]VVT55270.1 unnamed protein product [Saprochaete ingens]
MVVFNILVLPGDHIGPEIVAEAVKVLHVVEKYSKQDLKFALEYDLFGGASIDRHGEPITEQVLQKAEASDAVLFGSVGGPEWGPSLVANTDENTQDTSLLDTVKCNRLKGARPEQGVLELRRRLDCWANIRPVRLIAPALAARVSAIKEHILRGTDMIVLRENCGGAYFGAKTENSDFASDAWAYTRQEIERVTQMAGYLAENYPGQVKGRSVKITSCDKANVLANSRLWRAVVQKVHDKEFPHIELVHQLADSAAMIMVARPTVLNGVVLCDNTFGDILSDEAAALPGSLGLLSSASLAQVPGEGRKAQGLYEPAHGSAPDLPRDAANPVATILSAGLMLRYTCGQAALADLLDTAVGHVLEDTEAGGLGLRTRDLGGTLGTSALGDAIANEFKTRLIASGL